MMNIEELRKIFCEDGLYAVCVENGNLVSHYRIMCLRKNGAALINFVDARVTEPPRESWRLNFLRKR